MPVFTSLNVESPKTSLANFFNAADRACAVVCDITAGTCLRYSSKMASAPWPRAISDAIMAPVLVPKNRRSEERRVGKEWVSTGRSRWERYRYTKKERVEDERQHIEAEQNSANMIRDSKTRNP